MRQYIAVFLAVVSGSVAAQVPIAPNAAYYTQVLYWVALSVVAVVSMVIGPIVQWKIAQRQTQLQAEVAKRQVADNIAGRRQAWIDALRSEIAEFLTIAEVVTDLDVQRHSLEVAHVERRAIIERQTERMLRGILLKATIALRLNMNEMDHILLGDALDGVSVELNRCDVGEKIDREKVRKLHQPVVDKARIVLKKEWNRVKTGEI